MDDWNYSRRALEKAVIDAALNLFEHTGSHAFKVPVPNTTPTLWVAAGEETQLPSRAAATAPAGGVTDERSTLLSDIEDWLNDLRQANFNGYVPQNVFAEAGDFVGRIEALTTAARAAEPDPLQGAADWLKQAIVNCTATDIAGRLLVGHNRASRLFAASQTPPTGTSQGEGTS